MNSHSIGTPNSEFTPKAALVLASITMAAIDGDLDENEIAIINRICGSATSKAWDSAIAVWDAKHVDECIEMVADILDPRRQRVVLANIVDVAMADGHLDEAENVLLRAYVAVFKVSDQDVEKIVDVITIKNDTRGF